MPSSIAAGDIAFIGFGEAARAFLDGWRTAPGFAARVSAYDIKTDSPDAEMCEGKRADYLAANVIGASSAPEAVARVDAVFSLVTADQAQEAALAALPGLADGAFFFDCNSCAPQTKERTAKAVDGEGARYVDVAVMAPFIRGCTGRPSSSAARMRRTPRPFSPRSTWRRRSTTGRSGRPRRSR
jgi:3-hydroxyisobutyrate dehydrogenase-like beta-hydroxyacid dehydrogenase